LFKFSGILNSVDKAVIVLRSIQFRARASGESLLLTVFGRRFAFCSLSLGYLYFKMLICHAQVFYGFAPFGAVFFVFRFLT